MRLTAILAAVVFTASIATADPTISEITEAAAKMSPEQLQELMTAVAPVVESALSVEPADGLGAVLKYDILSPSTWGWKTKTAVTTGAGITTATLVHLLVKGLEGGKDGESTPTINTYGDTYTAGGDIIVGNESQAAQE